MDNLKFRAWDNHNKTWLLGYELPNVGGFSLTGEAVLFGEWSRIFDEFLFDRNGKKPDDLKIMQFTGLLDKNGKEIYEGDILKLVDHPTNVDSGIVEVRYSNAMFIPYGNVLAGQSIANYSILFREVIGNIYEHPNLLP